MDRRGRMRRAIRGLRQAIRLRGAPGAGTDRLEPHGAREVVVAGDTITVDLAGTRRRRPAPPTSAAMAPTGAFTIIKSFLIRAPT